MNSLVHPMAVYHGNSYTFLTRVVYRIVVNTAARTLTLYKNGQWYKSYPVAVGKPSTPTPKGTYRIVNKAVNPGGAFGARWLGLSIQGYGIHGTNNPSSIGKAVSNGCIRMYNKDIIEVFQLVPVGTVVEVR